MDLNPQTKLPDGVDVPFDHQPQAFQIGQTVELRAGEWAFGPDTLTLTITNVRRNGSGIWLDGTDERGTLFSHVLVPHDRAGSVAARWKATRIKKENR